MYPHHINQYSNTDSALQSISLYAFFFQNQCYACMPFAKRDYSDSETSDDGSTDDDDDK